MMRLATAFAALTLVATSQPTFAEATTYKIDPSHSAAQFSVRHMMISNVKGAFSKVDGQVAYDPKHPAECKVDAIIDISTVDTRDSHRDEHLKGADFFDVAKYPTMTFKSKKVVAKGNGLQVTGDLTLHGVTKEVVLSVDGPTEEIKDMQGNARRGASATTKINRQDFGISWGKQLDGGGNAVGNDVDISLDIEFVKPKA